jgi:hypothetical protein
VASGATNSLTLSISIGLLSNLSTARTFSEGMILGEMLPVAVVDKNQIDMISRRESSFKAYLWNFPVQRSISAYIDSHVRYMEIDHNANPNSTCYSGRLNV